MQISTSHRRIIASLLALAVTAGAGSVIVGSMGARPAATYDQVAGLPAGLVLAAEGTPDSSTDGTVPLSAGSTPAFAPRVVEPVVPTAAAAVAKPAVTVKADTKAARPKAKPRAKTPAKAPATTKPSRTSKATTTRPRATAGAATYSGSNHVWVPSLGINRSVHSFACTRQRPPDDYMYRWGCAGSNNVYLMGHAYSAMKPLHDAYVSGRLHVGLKAYYADGNGKVHTYGVRWWKLTRPTTAASWAWAGQDVPSMTWQTCVGTNSEYRLMVRLVEIKG